MKDSSSIHPQNVGRVKQMTSVGLVTAGICILAPFSIPVPFSPVPLTLTNFAVFLAVYILGTKNAVLSVLIYLLLGTAGLPVFSSFTGGPSKLAGPTGGYLIGFIFLALIHGMFLAKQPDSKTASAAGMITGMILCYTIGTAWLAFQTGTGYTEAAFLGVIPYLPGDIIKMILALIAGPRLRAAAGNARS